MQTLLKYLYMSLANRSSKYFRNDIEEKQTYQLCDAWSFTNSRKNLQNWLIFTNDLVHRRHSIY